MYIDILHLIYIIKQTSGKILGPVCIMYKMEFAILIYFRHDFIYDKNNYENILT